MTFLDKAIDFVVTLGATVFVVLLIVVGLTACANWLCCGVGEMKYDVILADPPWAFRVWNEDTGNGRSPSAHYHTMSIHDLMRIKVGQLASENCALFLWAVWPSLFENVPGLLDSWGFKYKTLAWIWIKSLKSGSGFATGMGYYTRANSEPCLLAIKGRMPVATRDVLSVIHTPRRAHSQKPDEQYELIERLYPKKKYLEMFARQKREGWHSWGNEVVSDVRVVTA